MKKAKKQIINKNFLDFIPQKKESFQIQLESKDSKLNEELLEKIKGGAWFLSNDNSVILLVENKGLINRVFQKLFFKPRVSQIHLEEFGSFIWQQIDGRRTIFEIGQLLKEHFQERAEPLYERLSLYIKSLQSNGFVEIIEKS